MTRRPWFESHEVAAKTKADRLAGWRPLPPGVVVDEAGESMLPDIQVRRAGRPVPGSFTIGWGGQVTDPIPHDAEPNEWPQRWSLPEVDRSVHMPPAETRHPNAIERARGAVADRVDTAIARSVGWLLSRSGLGR